MTSPRAAAANSQQPLRLWPGVLIVALQWFARFGVPVVLPEYMEYGVLGALFGGLAIAVWWIFFSRAPRFERWAAIPLMVLVLFGATQFLHTSVATGMMGMMFLVYVIPTLCLAFVLWAALTQHLEDGPRRIAMVVAIVVASFGWTLVRTGGFTGSLDHDFAWRWAATSEDRLLAESGDLPSTSGTAALDPLAAEEVGEETVPQWPGFRGPHRDGIAHGVSIATDWSASPPVELWRRGVGPGWSSFAVHGNRFFTQEQRGDEEVVSCYDTLSGEPIWMHRDAARFWESNAGAGPRGTPTLVDRRVVTFGATGILNVLHAEDGSRVWSRDVAADTGLEIPGWGFSSSPLVVDDVVLVAAAGTLVAYDFATGIHRWTGPEGEGYSSPHALTVDGVKQVLMLDDEGVLSVSALDGATLWQHEWPGYPMLQPALTEDGDVLISAGDRSGTRRLKVSQGNDGWTVEEGWTSMGLKPYFNDFVVHQGHAYGFDGSILASINLEDGERNWKGGRYGHGQFVLLADQDVLLVLSEKGELALVEATSDGFNELSRIPAIDGKTWNHPVLVDDLLLVRNSEEMVAFRLQLAGP